MSTTIDPVKKLEESSNLSFSPFNVSKEHKILSQSLDVNSKKYILEATQ